MLKRVQFFKRELVGWFRELKRVRSTTRLCRVVSGVEARSVLQAPALSDG
jgi:hypothetical protein